MCCLTVYIDKFVYFFIIFITTPVGARNPLVQVRVQKCTRGSACERVFPNPADLPTGGFSPNPHPSLVVSAVSKGQSGSKSCGAHTLSTR